MLLRGRNARDVLGSFIKPALSGRRRRSALGKGSTGVDARGRYVSISGALRRRSPAAGPARCFRADPGVGLLAPTGSENRQTCPPSGETHRPRETSRSGD
ncbi:hypothetical protein MRX96_009772 [Rhipicephalus microplus]